MSAREKVAQGRASEANEAQPWSNWAFAALLGGMLVLSVSALLTLPLLSGRITLEAGEVSPRTIRAPRHITYESKIRTERARQQAAAAVPRVYDPADPKVAQQQVQRAARVLDYINTIRHDPYGTFEQKRSWINQVPELNLPLEVISRALALDDQAWQVVGTEMLAVLSQMMRQPIREGLGVQEARRMLPNVVNPTLPDDQAQVVGALAASFIQANSLYNAERTDQERQAAASTVPAQMYTYEKDEVIVREGERVKAEQLEALEVLGLLQQGVRWDAVTGIALLVSVLVAALALYIQRLTPDLWADRRRFVLIVIVIAAFALVARLMVPGQLLLAYLFPAAAAPMLLSALIGPHFALGTGVFLSLIAGLQGGTSLELAIYVLIGSVVAALTTWRVERLNAFLWAGLYVALANLLVVVAFELQASDYSMQSMLVRGTLALLNAGLSTSLAIAGFYALGTLFSMTTTLQLMELARPTHPLLHQLQLKAPGTYHHSLIVSNMAEQAAQQVGADALLVRVGAYYHDIGKMLRPYFFIENQVEGANVHDRLDPETSAQIIISHVTDGLELASKYGVPQPLQDFIAQHHGTTLVSYFYCQACEEQGKDVVDRHEFRYPGPRPQTSETAILMLADSVEAAVRANRPTSAEEMGALVREIITRRLTEGELDACDLTLRDLDQIRDAFVRILKGIYHPRVRYPEEVEPLRTVSESEAALEM